MEPLLEIMSPLSKLITPLVSRRLFSTTVAPQAYYTSSLVHDSVSKKLDSNLKLYDFRSDTVTAPTDEMFDLMKNASRSDDVFQVRVYIYIIHAEN